ncbi:cupin [Patulibacter sp. S7RM1-6]
MAAAQGTTHTDDDRIRVTTWTFAAEADNTGRHVHELDYVVVPVTGGTFTVVEADGSTRTLTQEPGRPYTGTAGTEHDVVSASPGTVSFVEIELKR